MTKGFQNGDRVFYLSVWGQGQRYEGTITGHGNKNARLVYDVKLDDSNSENWGYAEQFVPLTTRTMTPITDYFGGKIPS